MHIWVGTATRRRRPRDDVTWDGRTICELSTSQRVVRAACIPGRVAFFRSQRVCDLARLAGNGEGCARVPVAIKFETEKSVEIAT